MLSKYKSKYGSKYNDKHKHPQCGNALGDRQTDGQDVLIQ